VLRVDEGLTEPIEIFMVSDVYADSVLIWRDARTWWGVTSGTISGNKGDQERTGKLFEQFGYHYGVVRTLYWPVTEWEEEIWSCDSVYGPSG